jgi:hypothetical protein
LTLIDKNGIDVKSFPEALFQIILIQQGKFNPKNKMFHEFDDIAINKTAKTAIIENLIPEFLQILSKCIRLSRR